MHAIDLASRQCFDKLLEEVITALPARLSRLLNAVPVCVEDWPDQGLLEALNCASPEELFGLYDGVPLTERGFDDAGHPSEMIYLFRGGLLAAARRADERLDRSWLQEQIRITLLHELGHHYGLDESRLEALGYD